nr:WYL domain-containing protein [uncultured Clostridium sp.]
MELFSEIYNCYYQVVARILEEAAQAPISQNKMTRIAQRYGYDESALAIIPHLLNGDWALLSPDDSGKNFTSRLYHSVHFPLTSLQKSWLKALLEDQRIGLFFTDGQLELLRQQLSDITPLYDPSAFHYFDQFQEQDVITSSFRRHFQLILKAVEQHQTLKISYYSVKQRLINFTYLPCWIEYSAKDGKFRLYARYHRKNGWRMDVLHIGRIVKIEETGYYIKEPVHMDRLIDDTLCQEPIVLEISDERNALERTMLHFSSYQKKVERLEETGMYRCSIYYDKTRETELLIQVLAFGPVVRVLGPASFLKQIMERVKRQQIPARN